MSKQIHFECEMNQGLLVKDSKSVLIWKCQLKSSTLKRMRIIPIFNYASDQVSDENPSVETPMSCLYPLNHGYHIHNNESPLNSSRETCVPPVPSSEAALAFCASSLEPACSPKTTGKVCVDLSFLVTANMFENPQDDWLATTSPRARARVEVNIKKLTADELEQFRAAQHKEMNQWISNDVMLVCKRAGIPMEGVMTMRWVHTNS